MYTLPLEAFQQARERIRPYVRHTPIAPAPHLTADVPAHLRLKLENLQVAGSFKARGAFNTLLQLDDQARQRGIVAASGGNHGVAVAYAAYTLGIPATIFLPVAATPDRIARVKRWTEDVQLVGAVWDEAHAAATDYAAERGLPYVHPFDADGTIAGQGTLGLELFDDLPEIDCVLIAIGGGGLIGGMAAAIKQTNPAVQVIGVEPTGAPSLLHSVNAGHVEPLPQVVTIAETLAPRSVSTRTLELAQQYVDRIVLVEDGAMIDSMRWLWQHYNQLVEPSGVAVIAALPQLDLSAYRFPVALICGGNAAADSVFDTYTDAARKKGSLA